MAEILTNPWVIIIVVLAVIIGNIAALKYTAKMKFGPMDTNSKRQSDIDKLTALDKAAHGNREPTQVKEKKKDAE